MEKLTLLWVDLTQEINDGSAVEGFAQRFTIKRLSGTGFDENSVRQGQVHGLVLEYDYPDRASLKVLRLTKQGFPSLPLIMLTEQHSEALAVWAFRTRVWDYMVKPVSAHQIASLHAELTQLQQLKSRDRGRYDMVQRDDRIPVEVRVGALADEAHLLQRAEAHISDHLADRISLDQMACLCGMTPYRFSRFFKKTYGHTFQEYLLRQRVEKAAQLLRNRSALVVDVAYLTGFRDPSYFARIFKRYTGVSPADFRQQLNQPSRPGPSESRLSPTSEGWSRPLLTGP